MTDDMPATKRLCIDIPSDLHTRIKVACAERGIAMVTEITHVLRGVFDDGQVGSVSEGLSEESYQD